MKGFSGFKESPVKQKPGGSVGEALEHHKKFKAKLPTNINMTGSSKSGSIWQKGKDLAKKSLKGVGKSNILAIMLGATKTATADQPKGKAKKKGSYTDDFTKLK